MPGRAPEELWGSLYNDFHSSEGGKRQQQRFCGPVVAMTFNFVVYVGIIIANKVVMGKVGLNFPVALLLIHYVAAWLLLAIFSVLSLLPASPPSKYTPFSSLFALGAVMAFSTGLANISLHYNSVGFYQMAKIAVTPTITLAEFVIFQKLVPSHKIVGLARAMVNNYLQVDGLSDDPVDIVGTADDGANTVNISTGASMLVVAAGARVAKTVKCKLLHPEVRNIVARGIIYYSSKKQIVHGVPLKGDCCKVLIDEAIKPASFLPIQAGDHQTVGEANKSFVAWPKKIVIIESKVLEPTSDQHNENQPIADQQNEKPKHNK